ncbi:unnamed protein product [Zymoseptoria tritici ST99CH_1E4]|uniref:Uncharacterized protein n=1 Tax=Zymoseptoria tritici ST99CH_1E4 TaxID=1276532 RepID=A0A2H1H0W6_ZYMTR|nr:unnamed protein product [Zymoseptoria tritici ST99CH_1E4]
MRFPLLLTTLLSALTSARILTSTDPLGQPAAHVHKAANFVRAEYHMLEFHDQPVKENTYYIAYVVRFETAARGMIVFQWKTYDEKFVVDDDIPARLVFQSNNDVKTDPSNADKGIKAWEEKITLGKTYRFGIIVNTSQKHGYFQMYVDGHDVTGRIKGNYLPGGTKGAASPKVGFYGAEEGVQDSYVYDVVLGTRMKDIQEVAGIPGGW